MESEGLQRSLNARSRTSILVWKSKLEVKDIADLV